MPVQVRIRENFKKIQCKNAVSGHTWTEHGPTTSYSVMGLFGEVECVKTPERAEQLRVEWQAFYDKVFP